MNSSQFFCTGCGYRLLPGKRFCVQCGKPAKTAPAPPPNTSGSLLAGNLLGGRWQITRQLGKGGMGAVYLVQDSRLSGRRAALKEMLDGSLTIGARQEAIDRFNREAETLAALSHPHVPHVYDRFTEADRIYMVMEYIDGLDLERLLKQYQERYGTALPERAVARYAYQLCSVLDYLHGQEPPTLHRDLKPSNIIVQRTGQIKLIDFGIAKVFNPGNQGTGLGTQGYAGPEQYRGQAEPRTDLYAMGATLHHLLTGRDPQLQTPFDFPRPSSLAPCSQGLEALLLSLLEMRPENRPANAATVRQWLVQQYPDIHLWPEEPQVGELLGSKPRRATRLLPQVNTVPEPAKPRFCTACGATLPTTSKFCSRCGQTTTQSAPLPPPPLALRVPPSLDGCQPLELLTFDEEGTPFCLLGVVEVQGRELAFVTPGSTVKAGEAVEVYVQSWQGSDAILEALKVSNLNEQADVESAWRDLTT